jgi:hypothetical protein
MKVPREVNGTEAARALKRLGFVEVRQTGFHRFDPFFRARISANSRHVNGVFLT